ncbi:MAG TPA: metallophosphoesterase [Thermoleophilia bacterium]|nr:metallophosphoesterase [Thermoleophilia bacterium]
MAFWKKKGEGSDHTRIFFATDVHGSERTFRKFINGAKFYKVNHIIMGGDITGKFLVPIVHERDSHYRVALQGSTESIDGGDELKAVKERIETLGFYHVTLEEDELHAMQEDRGSIDRLFRQLGRERLERWIALAEERLAGTSVKWYVTGGNDDPEDVLTVLAGMECQHVVNCEEKVVLVDDLYPMANCGYSNRTPWDTPREVDEEVLEQHLERAVAGIEDFANGIFNFHVPPYDCTLDECPKLDWSTDPPTPIVVGGAPQSASVGSTAARRVVEKYQPLLMLTGHIHESRGLVKLGRTTVINPGSEYGEGVLRGCIVTLEPGKVVGYQMTSG